tara:strand:+ start:244 stop:669 length:426 start_codon:yes stop_codon:yes gene_type:complete
MIKKNFIIILLTFLTYHGLAKSDNLLENDFVETQNIIENQIKAFLDEDAEKAFSYAAPIIKLKFNNPEQFITMVKNYYEPVYNPKQYYFIDSKSLDGSIYHQLQIISQSNMSYVATYSLVKDNGEWKISGCAVYPMKQELI